VSFFEPPPPPQRAEHQLRPPVWSGPPENVLGAVVPLELLLARSDKAAVVIGSATAYPSGVEFTVDVRHLPEEEADPRAAWRGPPWHYPYSQGGELPDELLRLGIEFADGAKVTTLQPGLPSPDVWRADEPLTGPVLIAHGGSGGTGRWTQIFWLWPLPPDAPLSFVCEWPAVGIGLSRADVDGALLREAASRSQRLWDEDAGSDAQRAWTTATGAGSAAAPTASTDPPAGD
jgi:hypothetical protein